MSYTKQGVRCLQNLTGDSNQSIFHRVFIREAAPQEKIDQWLEQAAWKHKARLFNLKERCKELGYLLERWLTFHDSEYNGDKQLVFAKAGRGRLM